MMEVRSQIGRFLDGQRWKLSQARNGRAMLLFLVLLGGLLVGEMLAAIMLQ